MAETSSTSSYRPTPTTDLDRRTCAGTFRLDVKATELIAEMTHKDVPVVLLKGHAFASLLYRDGAVRDYLDIDLLVPSWALPACERVLRENGFRPHLLRADDLANPDEHADSWRRSTDAVDVDLHVSLPELTCDPEAVWDALAPHLVPLQLAGEEIQVLDAPASALLAALHRAHHDDDYSTPSEDLVRATATIDHRDWMTAARLADDLGGRAPFLAGLGRLEEGRRLRARLGLAATEDEHRFEALRGMSRERRLYLEMHELKPAARASLALRVLAAHPRKLRMHSALARRGPIGLVAAYALRPLDLGRRLLTTAAEVRRERRRS